MLNDVSHVTCTSVTCQRLRVPRGQPVTSPYGLVRHCAPHVQGLSYMDEDFLYQLEGHFLDRAEDKKRAIHLNMAATQLRTGDYNTCIYNCTQASGARAGAGRVKRTRPRRCWRGWAFRQA
jgi:hypothetical protein